MPETKKRFIAWGIILDLPLLLPQDMEYHSLESSRNLYPDTAAPLILHDEKIQDSTQLMRKMPYGLDDFIVAHPGHTIAFSDLERAR